MKKCSTNKNPNPIDKKCPDGFFFRKNGKKPTGEDCCYKEKKIKKQTSKKSIEKKIKKSDNITDAVDIDIDFESPLLDLLLFPRLDPSGFVYNNVQPIIPTTWVHQENPEFVQYITTSFEKSRPSSPKGQPMTKAEFSLFPHQEFVRNYLQLKSPYRGLLLYHGLGVGKSCSSIAVAEMLLRHKKTIILLPASLRTNYITEIEKCGNKYFNREKYHWVFKPNATSVHVSEETMRHNKGIWSARVDEDPNYNSLSEIDRTAIDDQITSIIGKNYSFISYNGMTEIKLKELFKRENVFDNKTVIIDEVHNFISGVSNNSKITRKLYSKLLTATNVKIVLLSGTPIINQPHEIAYTMNLLHGYDVQYTYNFMITPHVNIEKLVKSNKHVLTYTITSNQKLTTLKFTLAPKGFIHKQGVLINHPIVDADTVLKGLDSKIAKHNKNDESHRIHFQTKMNSTILPFQFIKDKFDYDFIDEELGKMKNEDLFMKRIMGNVSFYVNKNSDLHPKEKNEIVYVDMSNYQLEKYLIARSAEIKLEERGKRKKLVPGLFDEQPSVYKAYSRQVCNFAFPEEIERPYPNKLESDNEYQMKISSAMGKLTDIHLSKELGKYSPKFEALVSNLEKSPGTALIYSQFRVVEGIGLLAKSLEYRGYQDIDINWNSNEKQWTANLSDAPKYAIFNNAGISDPSKKSEYTNILLKIFNDDYEKLPDSLKNPLTKRSNLRGEVLKVLFITQSGAEGISLRNVRQVHITEPFWNQNRIDQVVGRANRTNSHINLPVADRNFTSYTYIMQFSKEQLKTPNYIIRNDIRRTTDEAVQGIAKTKYKIITQFLNAMKKGSVDCLLNKSHDSCFTYPMYKKKENGKNFMGNDKEAKLTYRPVILKVKKPVNQTFLHVQETNELFDFDFYQKHKKFKKVGHIKNNQRNGASSIFLKPAAKVKSIEINEIKSTNSGSNTSSKSDSKASSKSDSKASSKSGSNTSSKSGSNTSSKSDSKASSKSDSNTSSKSDSNTSSKSGQRSSQFMYGSHFDAIVYRPPPLKLMNLFMKSKTAKKSDPTYSSLFTVQQDGSFLEKSYQEDLNSDEEKVYLFKEAPPDGDCFYHAVKIAMKSTHNIDIDDPKELRNKLSEVKGISRSVKRRLKDNEWAEEDEILLVAKMFSVRILVWVGDPLHMWFSHPKITLENENEKVKTIMLLSQGQGIYRHK